MYQAASGSLCPSTQVIGSLTARTTTGKLSPLFVHGGRPEVLLVLASWCEACLRELPRDLADARSQKDRISFVILDERDSVQAIHNLVASFHITIPILLDRSNGKLTDVGTAAERRLYYYYGALGPFGAIAEHLHITMLPAHFVVDATGTIRESRSGASPDYDPLRAAQLRMALASP
jgi:peroxiredoxin